MYLAVVLDAWSRKIIGWSMANHLRAELVVDALDMALGQRRPEGGVIVHSDQGSQYTSLAFGKRCKEAGVRPSMGSADAPTSPHLFAPKLKAEVYVAAAEHDGSYPPEMAERLEKALAQAGVHYRTETYPAAHGWMKPDSLVYNQVAAERGWTEMLALFGRILPR